MSLWPFGDGTPNMSTQSRELLKSWSHEAEAPESWRSAAELFDTPGKPAASAQPLQQMEITNYTAIKTTVETTKFEPAKLEALREQAEAARTEKSERKLCFSLEKPVVVPAVSDTGKSPLMRVHEILEEQSPSSRWLNQHGYLEPFKSPQCVLDLQFSSDARGLKVSAVVSAPCGSRRTIVACDDGTSFQRVTNPTRQELVRFNSNGQIIELQPKV